jgi:protocatechuate 3,4-dioxygenase, beta subunit
MDNLYFKLSAMRYLLLTLCSIICIAGCGQNSQQTKTNNKPANQEIKVGGDCEGCEAIYESPVAFEHLNEIDTLPDFNEPGPKIEISGIIFQSDGKTPASNVVLYIYHTDQNGLYSTKENDPSIRQDGWAKRHGYIRGWIKTNANGFYKFYTLVPASYPNSNNPKHIHPIIKEPGKSEYWIDDFVFDDDPLLPEEERIRNKPVRGSGVLKTEMKAGIIKATRNIILGLNVSDYPNE